MSFKDFIKEWDPKRVKKMSKDERVDLLYIHVPEIVEFYIKKGHARQDDVNRLFDLMEDPKFPKALRGLLDQTEENGSDMEPGIVAVISAFLQARNPKLEEESIATYHKVIDKILKSRIKKVADKTGLEKDVVKEVLVIIPTPDTLSNEKFRGIYINRVLNKLYALAKVRELSISETKTYKKLFKQLFGKDAVSEVAVTALLEPRERLSRMDEKQKAVWNGVTTFALDTIESFDKDVIRDLLTYYVGRITNDRSNNRDRARRIQFATVSKEDYPKIHKAIKKLVEKEPEFEPFLA